MGDLGLVVLKEMDSPPSLEGAFKLLARDERPFFLDTSLRLPGFGRFSLLGSQPFLVLESKGTRLTLSRSGKPETHKGNPFHFLKKTLERYRLAAHPWLPFVGGAVGYFGYDLCHFVERLPATATDDLRAPDMVLGFYDTMLVVDHQTQRAWIAAADLGLPGRPDAEHRAGELFERLSSNASAPGDEALDRKNARPRSTAIPGAVGEHLAVGRAFAPAPECAAPEIACNFTQNDYLRAIQRAKDYIAAGDIFQVNLSRRFEARISSSAPELYLRLRRINPAPMAAYLGGDDFAVVSASPERFLRLRRGRVETRPIKGTRPRGRTREEDVALARELLASEKDAAELAMIVDLERNDLGRVCSYGTVRVTRPKALESFPTVHHLVATVVGRLHAGCDRTELLKGAFPGGSITGAPKIRAMQIIDELEPTRRSVYTGAIGYLGFDGGMDLNIAIRTFLVRGNRAWFQAGGGIVADSQPQSEYDETSQKARALIEAIRGIDDAQVLQKYATNWQEPLEQAAGGRGTRPPIEVRVT
jgi:para-aminobenzoate synthetase component 1